jgi:hypothetical protein
MAAQYLATNPYGYCRLKTTGVTCQSGSIQVFRALSHDARQN